MGGWNNVKKPYYVVLPSRRGEIVENYLKVLIPEKGYEAWTLNDDLTISKVIGWIKNNGAWNYHNNYDESEFELYIKRGDNYLAYEERWFSINQEEVIKIQKENITRIVSELNEEITQINNLLL